MILELDIGNTRIKWRHKSSQGNEVEAEGVFADVEEFISSYFHRTNPEVIRLCSVREQIETNVLVNWSRQRWGLEPLIAEVSRECGGVSINYPDVSRLGVDRWLAMLAAYRIADRACLIADSGTAFTLDGIDSDGTHLGGFILPGIKLMRHGLETSTAISIPEDAQTGSIELGNSTDEAVLNGSIASLVALVEKYSRKLQQTTGQAKLFFSGGDAAAIAKFIDYENFEIIPGLVLDGLAIACPSHKESRT